MVAGKIKNKIWKRNKEKDSNIPERHRGGLRQMERHIMFLDR